MMRAKLLYIADSRALPVVLDAARLSPTDYTHVADVEAEGPDDVWSIAQNLDTRWVDDSRATLAPGGQAIRQANLEALRRRTPELELSDVGIRSMMVGDIVEVGEDLWLCDSVGWKRLRRDGDAYSVVERDLPSEDPAGTPSPTEVTPICPS